MQNPDQDNELSAAIAAAYANPNGRSQFTHILSHAPSELQGAPGKLEFRIGQVLSPENSQDLSTITQQLTHDILTHQEGQFFLPQIIGLLHLIAKYDGPPTPSQKITHRHRVG